MSWGVTNNYFYVFVDVKSIPKFQNGHQNTLYTLCMVEQPQRLSKERDLDSLGPPTYDNRLQGLDHIYRGNYSVLGRQKDGFPFWRFQNKTNRGNKILFGSHRNMWQKEKNIQIIASYNMIC